LVDGAFRGRGRVRDEQNRYGEKKRERADLRVMSHALPDQAAQGIA
jgi:hypothetical protein